MTGHVLKLRGCTPEPLGNYLKGLGAFRLIAEQADPQARAWWSEGYLVVHTKWLRDDVTKFFLEGIGEAKSPIYCPTPIFAPWGGRPGFYKTGNKDAKTKLACLLRLRKLPRFREAAADILNIRSVLRQNRWLKEKPKEKSALVSSCRNCCSAAATEWLDACLTLEEDLRFGFLFGTGGNEGSADITNNFWDLINEVIGLPTPQRQDSLELLNASLFGETRLGGSAVTAGQHFPLAAGSANCGQGFEGSASTNPWDFLMMMEGAVLFAGATTKRLSQFGKGKAAFPFMIDFLATGEPSESLKDEAKQDVRQIRCRAEFWMPLWRTPTSLLEMRSLLAEGRMQRRSGSQTEHTLHAMEAVKSLGVSRGIDTFHRVGLFERRGKGYYLASSLGFHSTSLSAASVAAELTEMEEFRQQIYRNLREGPGVPDRVLRARERFHRALSMLLGHDERFTGTPSDAWFEIVDAASNVEREVALLKDRSRRLTPCPGLMWRWLQNDDRHEYRLAGAVGGIAAWGTRSAEVGAGIAVEAIRANLLPVKRRGRRWEWDDTSRSAVWARGAPLDANLLSVLRRRLIDAQRSVGEGLPFWNAAGASFADILAFWEHRIDEARMADLIHGLALIDAPQADELHIDRLQAGDQTPDLATSRVWFLGDEPKVTLRPPGWLNEGELWAACRLPRVYHLLKLCFTGGRLPPRPIDGMTVIRTGKEPHPPVCLDVLTLLESGRLAEAAQVAALRLRAKGYPSVLRDGDIRNLRMEPSDCRRLAGMLLIPVRHAGVCAALAVKPQAIR